MAKIYPAKPFLIMLYGFPGAGKTYFARQFCEQVQAAHLQGDRIRNELFEKPRFDKQENEVVTHLMDYMTEEFLSAGVSVVYDVNATKSRQRQHYRDIAAKHGAKTIVVWFQMDRDTAFARNAKRDRRRADDKYAAAWDRPAFDQILGKMQNPTQKEDYVVVSGKHLFNMQHSSVVAKLRQMGILTGDEAHSQVIKPGLVNLVPASRRTSVGGGRNISIR